MPSVLPLVPTLPVSRLWREARRLRPALLPLALASALLVSSDSARATCSDNLGTLPAAATPAGDATAPRMSLLQMIEAANRQSKAVGAARLLAEAARNDEAETAAAALPQANLVGTASTNGSQDMDGRPQRTPMQLRPSVTVTLPLWDAGRQSALNQWRRSLSQAALQGQISTQEQVALQTVALAFDRSRYRLHTQVWSQYAQKMCTLVDSLEQIAAADKGRRSELVQARKSLQSVLLSRAQALSQLNLTEARLRKLVGDRLPEATGLTSLLLEVPDLARLKQQAADSPTVMQVAAQAEAAGSMAEATIAGQKPQVGWLAQLAKSVSRNDHSGNWNAGVQLTMPLFSPGSAPAAAAARQRAEAARLQRLEVLEQLQSRLDEVNEQAQSSITRARDVMGALRNSEQVRDDTVAMWQQLGRRTLFDVMSAEGDHFNLRLAYVDALHDGQQAVALMWSLAASVTVPLR